MADKEYTLNCKECSVLFAPKQKRSLFCSKVCNKKFYKKNERKLKNEQKPIRNCKQCSKPFVAKQERSILCSVACTSKYTKAKKKLNSILNNILCIVDGCNSPQTHGNKCGKHYSASKYVPKKLTEYQCVQCNINFFSVYKKKYCSVRCNKTNQRRNLGQKPAYRIGNYICKGCGVEFKPKKGDRLQYCSRPCGAKNYRKQTVYKEIDALKRIARNNHKELLNINVLREINALKRIKENNKKTRNDAIGKQKIKECPRCNVKFVFTVTFGRYPKWCKGCDEIVKKENRRKGYAKARKKQRQLGLRLNTHIKRAKHFGVEYDRKLSALDIFERDKWKCQLCGIKTPKKLKGKILSNAPELDHIIPLSQGGHHLSNNVQCACRSCNIKKSNTPLGQLLMF